MMLNAAVKIDQHSGSAVVHNGGFDRLTGKRADRVEGIPPGDDRHLHGAILLALKQRNALVAVNAGELRDDGGLQVRDVLVHAFRGGARLPDPRDHVASAPITTFHGRTRQRVARPCTTYGSARAKRSAISPLSRRNTSSAPSGGSPSAPAISSSPRACAARTRARCDSRCGIRLSLNPSTTS